MRASAIPAALLVMVAVVLGPILATQVILPARVSAHNGRIMTSNAVVASFSAVNSSCCVQEQCACVTSPTLGLPECDAQEAMFASGPCTNGRSTASCCTRTECTCARLRALEADSSVASDSGDEEGAARALSVGDDCTEVCTCEEANNQECTLVCGECQEVTVTLEYAFNGVLLVTRPLEDTLCAGTTRAACLADLQQRYPEESSFPVYFLSTTPEKPFADRSVLELSLPDLQADLPGSLVTPIVFIVLGAMALAFGTTVD